MLNWLEVSEGKLLANLGLVRQKLEGHKKIMAVVKANAYGHGLIEVAKMLESGVDWLSVVEVGEAIKLREEGIKKPILVMGFIEEENYRDLIEYKLVPSVYSFEVLDRLNDLARELGEKIDVHVEIDTGMNRTGFRIDEVDKLIEKMTGCNLMWQGIYSHFYNENNRDVCREQLGLMKEVVEKVRKNFQVPLVHMAKSQVALELPESHFNMVRVGGILYGLSKVSDEFQTVASFKAKVGILRSVKKGMAVGYDGCFIADKDMKVAVVTAGYADGFRSFSPNTGKVLINGVVCSIVGRVCMNQAMVDVSGVWKINIRDEVVLIGKQNGGIISPLEYAIDTKSAFYEVIARIPDHVKRIIVD